MEKKVLIFVHGMYGSNLVDRSSGKCAWINLRTVLRHWRSGHPVDLPIQWNETVQHADALYPESVATLTCQPWWKWTQTICSISVGIGEDPWRKQWNYFAMARTTTS